MTLEEEKPEKALEVPVRKAPPSYGPNNSARRANRRKGEQLEASPARPSSPPLLTPDSRSPASSRPASPFSPATPARRHSHHSHEELLPPRREQRRISSPTVSSPTASVTPTFTHPQLNSCPLRRSPEGEGAPRARSQSRPKNPSDPFDLSRFTEAQKAGQARMRLTDLM